MKKLNKISIILLILIAFVSGHSQTTSSFKVIVNKENNVTELSKSDISNMLLKKVSEWDNGQKIVPVDQKANSKVRDNFSRVIHKKSVAAIRAYWQKKIFTGKGVPPPEKSSDKDVVSYVKSNPGAIGYVGANATVTGTKTIKITK